MRYIPLESVEKLYDGYRQVFVIENRQLLLIQEKKNRYIIQADCPHVGWPLQNSPISDTVITCTQHGWAFDLETGNPANHRAENCQLMIYSIAYQEGTIGVTLE